MRPDRAALRRSGCAYSSPPFLLLLVSCSPLIPQIIFRSVCPLGIAGSRIIRSSAVVSVRENMYVARRAIERRLHRLILLRHILPNIIPPISCCSRRASQRDPRRFEACHSSGSRPRRRRPGAACCRDRAAPSCFRAVLALAPGLASRSVVLRHQRLRRCLARSARIAHSRLAITNQTGGKP